MSQGTRNGSTGRLAPTAGMTYGTLGDSGRDKPRVSRSTSERAPRMPDLSAGKCRELPGVFYAPGMEQETPWHKHLRESEALGYCHMCPVRSACAEWAIPHEKYGVWGGLTENERQQVRRQVGIQVRTPESYYSSDKEIILSRTRREHDMTQDGEVA